MKKLRFTTNPFELAFKTILLVGLLLILNAWIPVSYAADETGGFRSISLNTPIPGYDGGSITEITAGDAGFFMNYLGYLMSWVAGIVGMICIGIFIFSGFQIITSAGNSEMVSQAKGRIMDTIFGLMLLITSALVLHTINPGFFRWDPDDTSTQDASVIYYTSVKALFGIGKVDGKCSDPSIFQQAKESAEVKLEQLMNSCSSANGDKPGFRIYPAEAEMTPKPHDSTGQCIVYLTKYCTWKEKEEGTSP